MIRAYDPMTEELKAEGHLSTPALSRQLGFIPTRFGSTRLEGACFVGLAAEAGLLPIAGLEYFLDFDADPVA